MKTIPSTNEIFAYMHCKKCLDTLPRGESPQSYGRYEIGFTELGIQAWCIRHNCNIAHIDFQGIRHPANLK